MAKVEEYLVFNSRVAAQRVADGINKADRDEKGETDVFRTFRRNTLIKEEVKPRLPLVRVMESPDGTKFVVKLPESAVGYNGRSPNTESHGVVNLDFNNMNKAPALPWKDEE